MVRENRVFRTQAQKVSYEDILRALRVSSFFRLRCSLIPMNIYHDLLEKSGELPEIFYKLFLWRSA